MVSRRDALRLGLAGLVGGACRRAGVVPTVDAAPAPGRMPVLFVGHGSPMNAIEDTPWSRAWRALGAALPQPRAILCVSAHWYVPGTWVTGNVAPRTIHDFGGFPKALFEVRYPAKGDVALAGRIASLLASHEARTRDDWGLDHGAWSVLARVRPAADVPVLQLSVHRGLAPEAHLALGRAIAPLRDEGVLILASGNVTHNLPHALSGDGQLPAWASGFDADVGKALEQRDAKYLGAALSTDHGRDAHPTPDHYLPLLYAAGAASASDPIAFPSTGFDLGSISMRSVRYG